MIATVTLGLLGCVFWYLPANAIVGIDLADRKQMVVVTDHDSKVLARRELHLLAVQLPFEDGEFGGGAPRSPRLWRGRSSAAGAAARGRW